MTTEKSLLLYKAQIASASWTPARQKLVNQSVGQDGSLWLRSWAMLPQPSAA